MKTSYILIIVIGVAGLAVAETCPDDAILVPVTFQFQSPEFQAEWMYDALEPQLTNGHVHEVHSDSAVLAVDFCWRSTTTTTTTELEFHFGPRILKTIARPVQQKIMSRIYFLNQLDPDWLVIRRAQWIKDIKGRPAIDIDLLNYGKTDHPGAEIILILAEGGPSCASVPKHSIVPLQLSFIKGDLKLFSGDPVIPEPVERKAHVAIGACGELSVELDLGGTGSLPPSESLRIRYLFASKAPVIPRSRGNLYTLTERSLFFLGDRLSPAQITIK